ncbi:methyltransferase domain-containing protein [Acetobacterium paludosum]|uniref:Methyltransferase domain-containing protein n=1 Tax=Acetobacterium paludosum TaxID=52693 RepID=A0A923HVI8_9FIRM|nr:class I SAM-dependent methyltransferase [Acetobacterium paludosum]MBC3889051.1 methyltransferase domain-containing protein [Acetobacterium paludosum]
MENSQSTKEFFNNIAEKWDAMCYHDQDKIEAILTLADLKPGNRILDIATGTGILIPYLLQAEPEVVVAIDLSDQMIVQAQKKYPEPNVYFEVADFYDLNENGFDFAIAYSAYPHFPEKVAFSKKMAACLKPNGRFMIAHSESRKTINHRHSGVEVKKVSDSLKEAKEESCYFRVNFDIDILVDTDELYIISGKKI